MNPQKKTSPWAWIPTLYFAQGLFSRYDHIGHHV
mgnify:CR=1 FL=1